MELSAMELPSAVVFPYGVALASITAAKDKEVPGRQATNDQGVPLWNAVGVDMRALHETQDEDGQAKPFWGDPKVFVRIASETEPVLPQRMGDGLGAVVEFSGLVVEAFLSKSTCRPPKPGRQHFCGAELKANLAASGVRAFRARG